MSAELKKQACDVIDAMAGELVEASHAIHAKPEVAFEEVFAHGLLSDKVEAAGLNVERHACGLDTAFVSEFGAEETGAQETAPLVGIISEYDALPGIGHACGHNIIATTGLGASLALAKLGAKLPGRVRLPRNTSRRKRQWQRINGAPRSVRGIGCRHDGASGGRKPHHHAKPCGK